MEIKAKIKGLNNLYKFMRPGTQRRIAKSVTNKLIVKAKSESVNNIGREYNLPKRNLGSKLRVERATSNSFKARIYAPNRRLNIIDFKGTKESKEGGVVAVVRRGKNRVYPRGFIAQPTGKNWRKYGQKKQISSPKKLAFRRKGTSPYPLEGLQAWTLAQIIGGKWNIGSINKMIKRESKVFTEYELEKEFRKVAGIAK